MDCTDSTAVIGEQARLVAPDRVRFPMARRPGETAYLLAPVDGSFRYLSNGRRARILGKAPRGGLRIDGGDGGFAARTVSLIDIAWVAVASDDVRARGGLFDEARVNRLRYLEGAPRGSTRWIDTGWVIAVWSRTIAP